MVAARRHLTQIDIRQRGEKDAGGRKAGETPIGLESGNLALAEEEWQMVHPGYSVHQQCSV